MEKKKAHLRSHQKVDATKGRYLLPFKILEEEGGKDDPEAIAGSKLIMSKCAQMGAPWIWTNPQNERVHFLKFDRSTEDLFKKSWDLYQNELSLIHI
eukprot:8612743-Karenia_brevis.AAC.1